MFAEEKEKELLFTKKLKYEKLFRNKIIWAN
jgi:hypothetical protein